MAEAFKDHFDAETVERYAEQLRGPGFDPRAFRAAVGPLEGLPLKGRVARIADALQAALPDAFPEAVAVLLPRLPPPLPDTEAVSSTFAWWPLCTFVERHGQQHPDVALPFLRRLTRTFSAEFAIRPFLANAPQETLAVLASWLEDPDPHVRRWISEGTRPRLPWGQHLPAFTADPALTLPLLDALRSDPEPYVRRSVANHLGDIAKDHPDRAIAVARRWVGHTTVPPRGGTKAQQLVRHALRHLVKQGHPDALALMGFLPPAIQAELTVAAEVQLGGTLRVELTLTNPTDQPQPMLVDLGIRFRGADGSLRRPKVFKWTTLTLEAGQTVSRVRQQRLPDVTTRTHHGGHQEALARVNGQTLATATFRLAL